jgi:DNA-binding transcriptional LysR family regulator
MDLEEIKIKEINIFLELVRTNSVRELARQRNISPGQVSKIINSLERKVGFKLIERSSLGVQVTFKAHEIIPMFNEIRGNQESFSASFQNVIEKPILGFATTSFFSSNFLPKTFTQYIKHYPEFKIRLLEMPPDLFLNAAQRNAFQICLHLKEMDWPKTWTSVKVGNIKWILCCRKGHPYLKDGLFKNVFKYPFVYPVYWTPSGISYGNDNFPISVDKRLKGYETSTATSAVEVVRRTDHFGFVPEIVARHLIESGQIIKVDTPSLKSISEPVYLTVKSDRISQQMYKWMQELYKKELL